jgi:hypothetical protein
MIVTGAIDHLLAHLPWRRSRIRLLSVTSRPAHIGTLLLPRSIVEASVAHLRVGGDRGCEEFAFWSGHPLSDGTAVVTRAFHPYTAQGYGHVTIDDDVQLLSLTDIVHEHNELVLCQLHTHPGTAFHSATDDQGAFTDELGFLSLVLPAFGVDGLETAEVFRRTEMGWQHEGGAIDTGLIRVFDDVLTYQGGAWREG